MVGFYKLEDKVYRRLISNNYGVWLIDYKQPNSPIYATYETFKNMERVPVPDDFAPVEMPSHKAIEAKEKRMAVISKLIEDDACIVNREQRFSICRDLSLTNGVSLRTVQRWYFEYLAGGEMRLCPAPRKQDKKPLTNDQKNCRWAINKYYFSARRMSLQGAYDMMLLDRYTDADGTLNNEYPSFYQFKYYYYSKASDPIRKAIAREGFSNYQRNVRPLYGDASNGIDSIGIYQMDATIADIYLVSRHNRKQIIGRPVIYIAVDVVSRLIAGIYVGLESGEEAVAECLRQAAGDKVAYCARYGIDIRPEDWPSCGLPSELITDRGREFLGKRIDELCARYGIVSTGLPPYRPDLKGLVESTLHALQERYKYILKRMGVVEPDFQERGVPDYRREATLNLEEFTVAVLHSVVYLNSAHVLTGYVRCPEMAEADIAPVSAQIWRWCAATGRSNIIPVDEKDTCHALLPRGTGKFTRKGLEFRGLSYYHEKFNARCAVAGIKGKEEVLIAYEPACTDYVYLVENGDYIRFELTKANIQFHGSTYDDVQRFLAQEREVKKALVAAETQSKVTCNRIIKAIATAARSERCDIADKHAIEAINQNREQEKERVI